MSSEETIDYHHGNKKFRIKEYTKSAELMWHGWADSKHE